ncbi:MAG: hypothetical protein LAO78_17655 [Acidobacteriia bacterium]|nr:hypothetical protein [Terriglobia bacterium]
MHPRLFTFSVAKRKIVFSEPRRCNGNPQIAIRRANCPGSRELRDHVWGFFSLAVAMLAHVTVLLYNNRDRMAALVLRQPTPAPPQEESANAEDSKTALAGR